MHHDLTLIVAMTEKLRHLGLLFVDPINHGHPLFRSNLRSQIQRTRHVCRSIERLESRMMLVGDLRAFGASSIVAWTGSRILCQ
jgi:hypothetical protein